MEEMRGVQTDAKIIIDLTLDDSEAEEASSSSGSSVPWIENLAKKELAWLKGVHPLKSRKRPSPYQPGMDHEEHDNAPQFGSRMSTANGASARKTRRATRPQKPKSPRPKASPKSRRTAREKKTEAASALAAEAIRREVGQSRGSTDEQESSGQEMQRALPSVTSVANSDVPPSTPTCGTLIEGTDDADSLFGGDGDTLIEDADDADSLFGVEGDTLIEEANDADSLFGDDDGDQSEKIDCTPLPPPADAAEMADLAQTAAEIEALLDAEWDAEHGVTDAAEKADLAQTAAEIEALLDAEWDAEHGITDAAETAGLAQTAAEIEALFDAEWDAEHGITDA